MNKLRWFISWMSTRMKDTTFELYAENLLVLTYQDFNICGQEDMIRNSSELISPPPGPTTPMTPLTIHTSGSKKRRVFLSQHFIYLMNLLLNLLKKPYLTKMSSILPHLHFQSSFNSPEPQKLTWIFIHNQLWGEFPEKASSLKITRRLKWLSLNNTRHLVTLNPNHLFFWVNLILSHSKFTFMTIILHHLKMWINHVISLTPRAPLVVWMNQVHQAT